MPQPPSSWACELCKGSRAEQRLPRPGVATAQTSAQKKCCLTLENIKATWEKITFCHLKVQGVLTGKRDQGNRGEDKTCFLPEVLLERSQFEIVVVPQAADALLQAGAGRLLRFVAGLELGQSLLVLLKGRAGGLTPQPCSSRHTSAQLVSTPIELYQ